MNLEELCSWLSHQKGMMAQTYAKDLAKYIVRKKEQQIKELSDEEIIEIRDSCYVQSGIDEWEFDDVVFARAILKKASEK
jgi:heterodisulfide reductase subunit A-like polyferredoxin